MRRDHRAALALAETDLTRRNRAPVYSRAIKATVAAFLESTPRPLARIRRHDVELFLTARVSAGVAASTPARECSMLRVFFAILVKHEVIDVAPTDGLRVREPETPPQLFLSEDEIKRLLVAALHEPPKRRKQNAALSRALALRDRACLELLYGGALRDSELRAVLVVDLDLAEGSLLVRRAKRGRPRVLPLPPASVPHLKRYLTEGRPVIVRGDRDQGRLLLSARGTPLIQPISYAIVRNAGRVAGFRAHPHALRRAVATHLVRNKASVCAVRDFLGHEKLSTTAGYLALDRTDLRKAVELLERPEDE